MTKNSEKGNFTEYHTIKCVRSSALVSPRLPNSEINHPTLHRPHTMNAESCRDILDDSDHQRTISSKIASESLPKLVHLIFL